MKVKIIGGRSEKPASKDVAAASDCVFTFDRSCREYDWLVVFDEMPSSEILACPREHTILMTWEPTSIKGYSRHYTRQFGHLLTNRPPDAERHPHYHLGRGYFPWFVGKSPELLARESPKKGKDLSIACSSKRMRHTMHDARYRLVEEIVRQVPGTDWYGRGVRPFERKFEILEPYRYHVAVENHIAPHHWTEKIADALLCECLPFYAGDPDLGNVLPPESFIPIPIDDPAEAIRIIRTAIANDEFSRRREAVREAKRLLLTKYNFTGQILKVIREEADAPAMPVDPSHPVVIRPRTDLRWHSPGAALEDMWLHCRRGFQFRGGL